MEVESKSSANGLNKKKKKKVKEVEEIIYKVRESEDKESDSEEADFWMPPVGDRWDLDDGGDRWGSGSESEEESYEENSTGLHSLCARLNYFLLHGESCLLYLIILLYLLHIGWVRNTWHRCPE